MSKSDSSSKLQEWDYHCLDDGTYRSKAKGGTNGGKERDYHEQKVGLMMALRVGLTVVKGGTNNDSDKDYCWQRVGLTAENRGSE